MNLWFISDTHWGHENIYRVPFRDASGNPIRPFSSAEEADNVMIERWNAVVKPSDHIYHLGDVVIKHRSHLGILKKLNGHKRLVRGNHDIFKTASYLEFFDEIYGVRVIDGMIFTHIPLHPASLGRFKLNVHGHLHTGQVTLPDNNLELDPRYLNISVEHTNFAPISLDQIKARLP